MATTLAQAKLNTQDDVSYAVIDEFQKNDAFLDSLTFDDVVTPGAAGGSLTYAWTLLATENGAAGPRQFNNESAKGQATRKRESADLIPFSAAYEVDRVLANVGPSASGEVTIQTQQAVKSVRAAVLAAMINGGTNTDHTFKGLDELLTENGREVAADWSGVTDEAGAHVAIDGLDSALSDLDGDPTYIIGNRDGILKLRAIARRAGYYARERDEFGRQVESYAGVPFVDLGNGPASSNPIIPTVTGADGDADSILPKTTALYVVRAGLDAFHGASMAGVPLVQTWLPDFGSSGAVKTGEVEFAPCAPVLKRTKSAVRLNVQLVAD